MVHNIAMNLLSIHNIGFLPSADTLTEDDLWKCFVVKRETAHIERFLLLPQCFQLYSSFLSSNLSHIQQICSRRLWKYRKSLLTKIKVLNRVENKVESREIAISPINTMFSKVVCCRCFECICRWERVSDFSSFA